MGKNVAVFVDVANIFYAAKAAGVDIDYVTLLKAGSAGRDLVRAYAYTGLDPENENQRNFHDFLRRNGYKVVSKDIRKYGDGKVKANLDIELVVDMMKTARNLDVAIVVSGDGDFAPAIRAVQEMGVRVEVVSFRGNTSSDLMDVADQFTDIVQIAKVEKGSSRSGRRVAGDDEDLSMTEVPEKQSEGTGERRGRGGRLRRSTSEPVPVAAARRGRASSTAVVEPGEGGAIVVLPGEKLSRAAAARIAAAATAQDHEPEDDAEHDDAEARESGAEGFGDDAPRRRRRRGGRGRGRSRGHEENGYAEAPAPAREAVAPRDAEDAELDEGDERPVPARRVASAFGSVWDSQIGVPSARSAPSAPVDDEDFDEPAVPEYLLTERRQRDAGRGGNRGGRGRGGAYAAALDRERYGGGRGSTPSRFAEPSRSREGFGRNDRPERNDRNDRGGRGDRQGFRPAPAPAPRGTSDEPWSEVPPEIEAMLRAQLGSKAQAPQRRDEAPARPAATDATVNAAAEPAEAAPARRGRRTAVAATPDAGDAPAEAATARRTTGRRPRATEATSTEGTADAAPAKPTRARSTRAKAADADAAPSAPAKRTSRAKATAAEPDAAAASPAAEAAAPKRRTTRKKADAAG